MISGCVITQDEEECIERALNSINDFVEEIIVVDGGSTDRTRELVLQYPKVKLFDIPFHPREGDRNDVQKNNAIERASHPWILFMDADEYYTPYVCQAARTIISPEYYKPPYDAYAFSRKTMVDGWFVNPLESDWHIRLFRNYCRYLGAFHEVVSGYGYSFYTNLDIIHEKKSAWQQKDNERFWDRGQTPFPGWKKIDGKWVNTNEPINTTG